ncbi:MAG: hypothetical protein V4850_31860 [Myxococcota bacterium]
MRTLCLPLGFALLTLAAGCDPCASYTGTRFEDAEGELEPGVLDDLEATYDRFVAATGPGRVCIDRIVVESEVHPAGSLIYGGPDWVIEVNPAEMFPTRSLRGDLCLALDRREDIDAQAPDGLFDEGGFAGACACTYPDFAWHEEVVDACGVSPLSEEDQFMAAVAFPVAAEGRVDSALAVSEGAPVRLAGVAVGMHVIDQVAIGDGLLLRLVSDDVPRLQRVVHVDLDTGVVTDILSSEDTVELYGGAERGVVRETLADQGGDILHVVDAETLEVGSLPVAPQSRYDSGGTVSDGALYSAPDPLHGTLDLQRLDLDTGAVTTLTLPPIVAPLQVLPDVVLAVPGGLVMAYREVEIERSGDMVGITVGDAVLARWSAADGAWTELTRAVDFAPSGAMADGRLVGTVHGAGTLLAAYAYDDDHLAVSVDTCVTETNWPAVVAGERAWSITVDGADILLSPYLLD